MFKNPLAKTDSQIAGLIRKEALRHQEGLDLVAAENYPSPAVRQAVGSVLSTCYAEGCPGKRYYPGLKYIDQIEQLAIERAKKLFGANYANVQPHSGSQANQAVYLALLEPGDKILAMDLAQGGHLSHGSPANFSGRFFNCVFYGLNEKTEIIDWEKVTAIARQEKPKLIIAGASSYPRRIDFKRFGAVAKETKAYLMADIAHIAGLVAAGLHPHPFPYCDIVTMTTHKTLRGARGGIILSNKKDLADKIDRAVFPGLQGGPLENEIAGKAVALKEAGRKSFIRYQKQVVANAQTLAKTLLKEGLDLVAGGTDNHFVLVNLTKYNLSGKQVQEALEEVNIYANRNVVPYDRRSKWQTSGIRLGTPAITTKGLKEKEVRQVGVWIAEVIKNIDDQKIKNRIKAEVIKLSKKFPLPYENY
ncbi:MAG: serine hydroxymethyltransferase [Candidatus Portnoybacteria bacterium CG_4_8_14_3_um_filter_44_15]|uniref:Serine hydroxymethyltransferase n=3 Tax=Candidatus Portnoyibacteriota TaxID=1817913 RepID=A0A2M7YMB8_9BACT|nr:MAG: serine hydroxymethyltransferase [Candidatus Portnoybacteria bacterium CG23_combo_of_CG06-09_8_20_14_all_44_36]PIW74915.1 MAG: serine hydroxymethyltransferase [Candidatus Portnoybacteria bacterium CG_4_8_14_3_um_filter_44_15]PJA64135.1 MAG: serine hydroxymethyltransferase [Candidatus Portnoybacteria bacterium CG_4_9_14_3_um_filter_43_11]PJE59402.1 MAG: serine hydroxymethyltransferase [Candidatus Portnoybacteria bacterium CG10_big_fil_rev_8_21_14_0_10_43_39]